MKTHPGRALYTLARYWRSVGIQHMALTLPAEELPSLETLTKARAVTLESWRVQVDQCRKCSLGEQRERAVYGEGNAMSSLVFIAGPPDLESERNNASLQGEVGELFDRMLEKMGLHRSDIYITPIVKCRPPEDRHPHSKEVESCHSWLTDQLELISPKVIVTLGSVATKALLKLEAPITQLRGHFYNWKQALVMPTYHPAYLLKKTTARKDVWTDMLAVLDKLNTSKS